MRRTISTSVRTSIIAAVVVTAGLALSASGTPRKLAQDRPSRVTPPNFQEPGQDEKKREASPLLKKFERLVSTKPVAKTADGELNKLLVARCEAAIGRIQADLSFYEDGTVSEAALCGNFLTNRLSFLELSEDPNDRLPILKLCVEATKRVEAREVDMYAVGRSSRPALLEATYNRIDAEINLLRETRKQKEK